MPCKEEALNRELICCASISLTLVGGCYCGMSLPWPDVVEPGPGAQRHWEVVVGDVGSWQPVQRPWRQRGVQGEAVEKELAGDHVSLVPCW